MLIYFHSHFARFFFIKLFSVQLRSQFYVFDLHEDEKMGPTNDDGISRLSRRTHRKKNEEDRKESAKEESNDNRRIRNAARSRNRSRNLERNEMDKTDTAQKRETINSCSCRLLLCLVVVVVVVAVVWIAYEACASFSFDSNENSIWLALKSLNKYYKIKYNTQPSTRWKIVFSSRSCNLSMLHQLSLCVHQSCCRSKFLNRLAAPSRANDDDNDKVDGSDRQTTAAKC